MIRDDLRRAVAVISLGLAGVSSALAQTPQPGLRLGQVLRPANAELVQNGLISETDFGRAVAVRDNLAAFGIPGINDPDGPGNPLPPVGRVGLWTFDGTNWQRSGSIDPPSSLPTVLFGGRVALGPSRAFVTSFPDRVDVFSRSGSQWVHEQRLTSGLPLPDTGSVLALAFDAGWLVVKFDEAPGIQVYARRNGTWQRVQVIEGPAPTFPAIGPAVAIADGTLVIGAPFRSSTGAAFIYRLNSSGVWTLRQQLTPPDGVSNDRFGWSVATENGLIAVGAIGADRIPAPTCGTFGVQGAAYLYAPSGSQWALTQKLMHQDVGCQFNLGMEVAITPTHVAVKSSTINDEYRTRTVLYRRNGASYEPVGYDGGQIYFNFDGDATLALNATSLLTGVALGFPDLPASGRVEAYSLSEQADLQAPVSR